MSGNSSALLQAAKLWQRTSARGTTYMSGRLGGVRVPLQEAALPSGTIRAISSE
jgi:hypothetical protein